MSKIRVVVVGEAERTRARIPREDPLGIAIMVALVAIQDRQVKPKFEQGKSCVYRLPLKDGRVVKFGCRRPDQNTVEVHVIKVVKRRRRP